MLVIEGKNEKILLLICVALYAVLRVVAWNNAVILDDHDSTFYLKNINAYRSFEFQIINALSAYSTPFYPLLSAILTLFGLSIEFSARLVSFIFSFLLFFAFYGIGKKVTGSTETLVGLFILALSPALLPISFAILTEQSYLATIYIGLFLFLFQLGKSNLKWSAILGFVFGLAFLNRTEGILFIAVMPAMQAFYLLFVRGKGFPVKEYSKWCGVYGVVFIILAAPQIWHVSSKMGALSLNGRIAWQLLENSDIGQNREEKQYGLYFKKDETNILFAKRNYREAKKQLLQDSKSKDPDTNYLSRAEHNSRAIVLLVARYHLGKIGSVLALIGIVTLYLSGRRVETLLITGFAVSTIAAILLHADTILGRHLLGVAPALILFQAVGTVYLAKKFSIAVKAQRLNQIAILSVIVSASMLYAAKPLYRTIVKPPVANFGYGIEEIQKPLKRIREVTKNELHRKPVIAAKKNYIAYYTDAKTLYLPYAGYDELVEYLGINSADFLYLRYDSIPGYPFLKAFERGQYSSQFELLLRGVDAYGGKTELYRFVNSDLAERNE